MCLVRLSALGDVADVAGGALAGEGGVGQSNAACIANTVELAAGHDCSGQMAVAVSLNEGNQSTRESAAGYRNSHSWTFHWGSVLGAPRSGP